MGKETIGLFGSISTSNASNSPSNNSFQYYHSPMSTSSTISSTTTNNIDIANSHLPTPSPSTISATLAVTDLDCSSILMNDSTITNDLLMNVSNNVNSNGSNLTKKATNNDNKKLVKSETIVDLEDIIGLTFDGQFYRIQDNQLPELVSSNNAAPLTMNKNTVEKNIIVQNNEKQNLLPKMKSIDLFNESSATNSASSSPLNTNNSYSKSTATLTSQNPNSCSSSSNSNSNNGIDSKINLLNTDGHQLLIDQTTINNKLALNNEFNCNNLFSNNNVFIQNLEQCKPLNNFLWTNGNIIPNQFSPINMDSITGIGTNNDLDKNCILLPNTEPLLEDNFQVLIFDLNLNFFFFFSN